MIRLPSFFKRKTPADDLELGSVGRRTVKRAAPRSLQRAAEAEELALTEDPEQQRARHRLIGATVLVLIAVVCLPRILDNKPKAVNNDIAVNIVTSLPTPTPTSDVKPEEKAKTETPAEAPKAAVPAPEVKAETKPDAKTEVKAEVKSDAKPPTPAPSKAPALGLAAGEEVVASSSAKPSSDAAKSGDSANAQTNTAPKYYIQIGAYGTEENAKSAIAKLKAMKLPPVVLYKTNSDGAKLALVRAGPYPDKDAALAVEKKLKAANLPTKFIVVGKQ